MIYKGDRFVVSSADMLVVKVNGEDSSKAIKNMDFTYFLNDKLEEKGIDYTSYIDIVSGVDTVTFYKLNGKSFEIFKRVYSDEVSIPQSVVLSSGDKIILPDSIDSKFGITNLDTPVEIHSAIYDCNTGVMTYDLRLYTNYEGEYVEMEVDVREFEKWLEEGISSDNKLFW